MRVALINPSFNNYGGLSGHGGSMAPINLCYLAAYGRGQHPDVEFRIIDSEVHGLSHEETVDEIAKFDPTLIGISANTCVFDSVIQLSKRLKERFPKTRLVIGGSHPSALPEQSLYETGADFMVIGEGERQLSQVIGQLKDGDEDWSKLKGIVCLDNNGVAKRGPTQELFDDLDVIPFPARDLIDNNLYFPAPTKRVRGGPHTLLVAGRGCPYNCGFCSAQTVWTRKIRGRSPANIVAEVEHCIGAYGVHSFNFTDELFTVKKARVLEICGAFVKNKLDMNWVCSARAHHLDMETLEAMREAGCREISFGIESGSEVILKNIDKAMDLKEAERVVNLTKKAGIKTHASYMFGYLGETEETMQKTISFAKRLNTEIAAFFIASPLPGTPFYSEALEKGYVDKDISWINFSPLSNEQGVISYPGLSAQTIRKWHRKAIHSYYLRPAYILRRLYSLRHWHEVENLFAGLKLFLNIKN